MLAEVNHTLLFILGYVAGFASAALLLVIVGYFEIKRIMSRNGTLPDKGSVNEPVPTEENAVAIVGKVDGSKRVVRDKKD